MDADLFLSLVMTIEMNADRHIDNLKFGKLLRALLSKYSGQVGNNH